MAIVRSDTSADCFRMEHELSRNQITGYDGQARPLTAFDRCKQRFRPFDPR
jgi:hypothetical protein